MRSGSVAPVWAGLVTTVLLIALISAVWRLPLAIVGQERHWTYFLRQEAQLNPSAPCRPEVTPRPPHVKRIVVVGDILLANWMEVLLTAKELTSGDPRYPFGAANDLLRSADICAGNLESPMISGNTGRFYTINFSGDPDRLDRLAAAGFDLLTLANNHMFNYGDRGLIQTMQHLSARGMAYTGAGENEATAYSPRILTLDDGVRVGWLGFNTVKGIGSGSRNGAVMAMAPSGSDRHLLAVRRARGQVHFLAVFMHWGDEYVTRANTEQQRLGRQLVDAGADLVVGSHPHRVQGFERYKDGLIVYSLGNFAFALNDISDRFARTTSGAMLQLDLADGKLYDFQFIPVLEFQGEPVPLTASCRESTLREARQRLLATIWQGQTVSTLEK